MSHLDKALLEFCEASCDLALLVSRQDRLLYANPVACRVLGIGDSPDEGQTFSRHLPEEERAHFFRYLEELTPQKGRRIACRLIGKDGEVVSVEGNISPLSQGSGELCGLCMLRNRSEIDRSREELNHLFLLSQDLLCVAGTDGYFKRVNPAFERLLGYGEEELLSRSFLEFVHPDDRDSTLAEVDRLARGKSAIDFQNRYRAKDGSYLWLSWRSTPLPAANTIYAVARDITRQKELQQQMEAQAEDLARSNEDLEQFAYVASHDLRAPLRAISNLVEWIEEDAADSFPEKSREHVIKIKQQVGRMERLIDDLLAYARAGQASDRLAQVDISGMIEQLKCLLDLPPQFELVVQGEMPTFETDRPALEQVLRNLLANAVTHHDRGRGRIVVSVQEWGRFYEFRVGDDGPGVPPSDRTNIFKMFHKLGAGEAGGTGIGLALVKRIVEAHGGQIWVGPSEAGGATFHFNWPKVFTRRGQKNAGDPDSR